MKKTSKAELKCKNIELATKNKELTESLGLKEREFVENKNQIIQDCESKLKSSKEECDLKIQELSTQTESFKLQVEQKQAEIDKRELKKLAQAYREQEDLFKEDVSTWIKRLATAAVLLSISMVISIYLASGKLWYDRFEYYLIDFILISIMWFCGSQYSDYVKLRNDYANRKTVAQSFHNILNNLQEDQEIKNKFIEKATDVLCAPSIFVDKEPILSKKLIKETAEIVKSVAQK